MRVKRKAYLRQRKLLAFVTDVDGFNLHSSSSEKDVGPVANEVLGLFESSAPVVLTGPLNHVILLDGVISLANVLLPGSLLFRRGPKANKI